MSALSMAVRVASLSGKLFRAVTNLTTPTYSLPLTAYAAANPILIIEQDQSALAQQQNVYRSTLADLRLSQSSTVAGGPINLVIAINTIKQYANANASQLTYVNPNNKWIGNQRTAQSKCWLATAAAAGLGTGTQQIVLARVLAASVGSLWTLAGEPDLAPPEIGQKGAILVYAWAATTGPSFTVEADVIEEPANLV